MKSVFLVTIWFCLGTTFAQQVHIPRLAETLGATTLVNYLKTAGLDTVLSGSGKLF